MGYRVREFAPDDKMCQQIDLPMFEHVFPVERIATVLSECGGWEVRERTLNMVVVIYLLIALSLYPKRSQPSVLQALAQGTRLLWPAPEQAVAGGSAIAYRRKQLGVLPLQALFEQSCHPLSSEATKGAFRLGRRLMAIDSTWQAVPDTLANSAAFGRFREQPETQRSPCPHVRCTVLLECGTHLIVGADLAPCRHAEEHGAHALLSRITSEMLVTLDAGFFSGPLFWAIRQRGAHVLGRVPAGVLQQSCFLLADGTSLAAMIPYRSALYPFPKPLLVRIIEYRVTDKRVANPQTIYRLATTLLNPRTAPAHTLIELYHERWEIETSFGEIKTHQRLCERVLRSQTPEGVLQELYAILLAHDGVRALMHEAAQQADLDPDRLSFTAALQLVRAAVMEFALVDPLQHEALRQRLLRDLRRHLLPPRRFRIHARVVKFRYVKFRRKRPSNKGYHFKGLSFEDMVLLI